MVELDINRTLEAGTYEYQPFIVPETTRGVSVKLARKSWPDTGSDIINCQIWISYDGGRKYSFLVGMHAVGGDISDSPESACGRKIKPQYKTNPRMVKVIVISKELLTSDITLEFW